MTYYTPQNPLTVTQLSDTDFQRLCFLDSLYFETLVTPLANIIMEHDLGLRRGIIATWLSGDPRE